MRTAAASIHCYPRGHTDPKVAAVCLLLDKWLVALDSGEVEHWMPDPDYPKQWTEERLNEWITEMDKYMKGQRASWGKQHSYEAGPEYSRLKLPQRLAMMQALDRTLAEFDGE